jgi:hypothetical protein
MENIKVKNKISNLILESLCELRKKKLTDIQTKLGEFFFKCSDVAKDSGMFCTAVKTGMFAGADNVRTRISTKLNDLKCHLQNLKDIVNGDEYTLPSLADIFKELTAAEQEFGQLKMDVNDRTISIITETIVLEGVTLGPFEIKLFIDGIKRLYQDSPYKAIALEPNPAGANEEVTHPHVSSERLCEGDGHMPIQVAIRQGRIFDFFTLVVNILNTYNPSSPHISIDDWEGISCHDCGRNMSRDETYYCEDCDNDYCESCSSYCRVCDETTCLGCGGECSTCGEFICPSCSRKCAQCGAALCKNCIDENLCPNCVEERDNDEEVEEEQEDLQTSIKFFTDSVEQAAVLPGHDGQ